ncbi:MAG: hypothetical protein AAFS10_20540, partial [Myxococcota bacterium]
MHEKKLIWIWAWALVLLSLNVADAQETVTTPNEQQRKEHIEPLFADVEASRNGLSGVADVPENPKEAEGNQSSGQHDDSPPGSMEWKLDWGVKGSLALPFNPDIYTHHSPPGGGIFLRGRLLERAIMEGSVVAFPFDPRHPHRTPDETAGMDLTFNVLWRVAELGDVQCFIGSGTGLSIMGVSDLEGQDEEDDIDPKLGGLMGMHWVAKALFLNDIHDLFVFSFAIEFQYYTLGYDNDDSPEYDEDTSLIPDNAL